jgi:periplasmic protein TonB
MKYLIKFKIFYFDSRKFSLLVFCFAIMVNSDLNCQEIITLYYNHDWEITKKENAVYFREAVYDLNTFKIDGPVRDFSMDSALLMEGLYNSHKRNGVFRFFDANGNLKSEGKYVNHLRNGNWVYYYPENKVKLKVFYHPPTSKLKFSVAEFYDNMGNQLITKGTGKLIIDSVYGGPILNFSYNRLTGQFKDSLMTGTWKLTRLYDNKTIHSEQFRKGQFISASVYSPICGCFGTTTLEMLNKLPDENGARLTTMENFTLDATKFSNSLIYEDVETIFKTITGKEYKIKQRPAMYPQGDASLLEFIGHSLRYPISAVENKTTGKVYVNVVIDSQGKPINIYILRGVNKELDSEALRVVRLIEVWLPAIQEGENIESTICIPVKFEIN